MTVFLSSVICVHQSIVKYDNWGTDSTMCFSCRTRRYWEILREYEVCFKVSSLCICVEFPRFAVCVSLFSNRLCPQECFPCYDALKVYTTFFQVLTWVPSSSASRCHHNHHHHGAKTTDEKCSERRRYETRRQRESFLWKTRLHITREGERERNRNTRMDWKTTTMLIREEKERKKMSEGDERKKMWRWRERLRERSWSKRWSGEKKCLSHASPSSHFPI